MIRFCGSKLSGTPSQLSCSFGGASGGHRVQLVFLPDGSPDCPLIRLFDFTAAEAQRLCGYVAGESALALPFPR